MEKHCSEQGAPKSRRQFIGGSDARVIMGQDGAALLRLWREKRAEAEPEDLSRNLLVQLGRATEDLNRRWYEVNTQQRVKTSSAMRATCLALDGGHPRRHRRTDRSGVRGQVHAALVLFRGGRRREAHGPAAALHVGGPVPERRAVHHHRRRQVGRDHLPADPLYQHVLLTAEKRFWRCVESGEPPRLFAVDPPRPRLAAVRVVDMSTSNAWAAFTAVYCRTRSAFLEHEQAKAELKELMPEDAKEAHGHGVRAKRSRSGVISFELRAREASMHRSRVAHRAPRRRAGQGAKRAGQPAKSLTAVLERDRTGRGGRAYRYAPLSSGLDIVRKSTRKARDCDHADHACRSRAARRSCSQRRWPMARESGLRATWPVCRQ